MGDDLARGTPADREPSVYKATESCNKIRHVHRTNQGVVRLPRTNRRECTHCAPFGQCMAHKAMRARAEELDYPASLAVAECNLS